MTSAASDARLQAFLSPQAPEIFHSVQHRHEIWREDPFDVESLHPEARDVFARLLLQATTPPGLPSGRILLILGESGSGKTHLLRAFRNGAHAEGHGYVGYMQMTTATHNYGRYMLSNLIDSLDQPYYELISPTTSGLMRLAHAVASRCPAPLAARLLEADDVHAAVHDCADAVVRRFGVDLDLVRALLYLNRDDPQIKSRVMKYLRCEPTSSYDQALIGGLYPRVDEDDPMRMLEAVGRLVWVLGNASLVLCVDQLEDIYNLDDAAARFRRAASALTTVMDRVPSSIVVISCLADFWDAVKAQLTRSLRDRIEEDPPPVQLVGERSLDEVRSLVGRRLSYLYERFDVANGPDDLYPFTAEQLAQLARRRTRDVLDGCRHFRERLAGGGEPAGGPRPPVVDDGTVRRLEQTWNDFLSGWEEPRPDTDAARAELLAWAVSATGDELESGHAFAARVDGEGVVVDVQRRQLPVERLLVRICNRATRGGGLTRQIVELRGAAGDRVPVIVRSTDFPSGPRTQVAEELGKFITAGGRRAVLEDSALKTMMALREFRRLQGGEPRFGEWLHRENVLSQMAFMRAILALDRFGPADLQAPEPPPRVEEPAAQPAPPPSPAPAEPRDDVVVGRLDGLNPQEVLLRADDLRRHAAFLGSSGSGKTTMVLNIVEDLLLRGVPVILVDRKGDLCGYARPEMWERPLGDPAREERRRLLRERIDVQVFTPGANGGRPLSVPLVPDGLGQLPADERADEATLAAHAIGGMLEYKHSGKDKTCRAILIQAVTLLAQSAPRVTLEALIRLIADEDPMLVNAVGRLDTKLFNKVVQDLETFRMTAGRLLAAGVEILDLDALFGAGPHAIPGKARLSIVSTKFMDHGNTLFWVAQLLLQAYRWAVKRPSATLQGAILLDEADMYLPATSQPATKQPMENLLKRARSAGLSVLLATQNPGDLDYKCRDNISSWFVGKVTQPVSINKMRPMLAECRIDVSAKLASRRAGQFFFLRNGDATPVIGRLPAIMPDQISADDILALAVRSRPAAPSNLS